MLTRVIRWVGAVLGALVLAIALVGYLDGGGGGSKAGSMSYSAHGRRGAFLLLESYGHRVLSWRQAPASLADLDSLLVVQEARFGFASDLPSEDEGEDEDELDAFDVFPEDEVVTPESPADPRHLSHYREFLDGGGRALVGLSVEEWLREGVGVEWDDDRFAAPRANDALYTPAGEALRADFEAERGLPRRVEGADAVVLLEDGDGAPFAALYELSRGSLVIVADTRVWTNERLREADHAFLLVSLVGLIADDRVVLFDDFALGDHDPHGLMHLLFVGRGAPVGWSVLLLIVVAVGAFAPARRFPRDPAPTADVNPYTRVLSVASLLERARGRVELGSRLRAAIVRRMGERLRVRERDEDAILEVLARRAPTAAVAEEWTTALRTEPVGGARELEQCAERWRAIERAVEDSLRRETREGAGPRPRTADGRD